MPMSTKENSRQALHYSLPRTRISGVTFNLCLPWITLAVCVWPALLRVKKRVALKETLDA